MSARPSRTRAGRAVLAAGSAVTGRVLEEALGAVAAELRPSAGGSQRRPAGRTCAATRAIASSVVAVAGRGGVARGGRKAFPGALRSFIAGRATLRTSYNIGNRSERSKLHIGLRKHTLALGPKESRSAGLAGRAGKPGLADTRSLGVTLSSGSAWSSTCSWGIMVSRH